MSYFKLFFEVLKAHKINVILPLSIVIIFSVVMVNSITNSVSEYNPDIYVVDNDNTELSKSLIEEIDKYANIKEYHGNEDIEEEFMKSFIMLYIEIPKGFEDNFNEYKNTETIRFKSNNKIIIKSIENSKARILIKEKIDNFLNSKLNNTKLENNDFLKLEISSAINTDDTSAKISAINFAAYGVLYGIPSIIGTFFMKIRKKNIKDRYSCAPVSNKQYLLQVIIASIFVTVIFSLMVSIFIMNVLFSMPFGTVWLLNFANVLLMAILGLGLGLIYGMILNNMEALTGMSTGISLALAFLGGLFVPIEIFSDSMRKIAVFTPAYWYETLNNALNSGSNNITTNTILTSYGMECVFIIIVFILVAIVNRKKQQAK